ncbi:MAG: DUF2752 domain-containing protein [Clostridium sp.]|nr:DUF2752 domain-containing protein [Clostridium sp.]
MNNKELNEYFKLILCITLLYIFYNIIGIGCPIKFLTGVSCAGCGMTRAWICLLNLDVKGALYYHPLVILPGIYLVMFLLRNKIQKCVFRDAILIGIFLFVATYIFRILNPDDVVNIDIENGFIYKIFRIIY